MHLNLPILLSLLTSTTLALPTTSNTTLLPNTHNNATTPSLDKRTKAGWIGSFPNAACSGPVAHNVVQNIHSDICYKFTPTKGMAWVGVNYGSGDDQFSEVTFFVDDGCKYNIGGFRGAGFVFQSSEGSGMTCSNLLGSAKSFKIEDKMQSII